ncbi:hypothetical protein [Streptomyces hydrogenans]|uniref:hypothetical protein n=1 Tax=Streptomyces hydrogenans TaxID=1873719 RepID=UPI003D715A64
MNHQHGGSAQGRSPRYEEGPDGSGPRRLAAARAIDARGAGADEELLRWREMDEELLLWRIVKLLTSMPDTLDDTVEDKASGEVTRA